jgi:hypothetical protein
MIEAMQEMLAIERGEQEPARVHVYEAAPLQTQEGPCPD